MCLGVLDQAGRIALLSFDISANLLFGHLLGTLYMWAAELFIFIILDVLGSDRSARARFWVKQKIGQFSLKNILRFFVLFEFGSFVLFYEQFTKLFAEFFHFTLTTIK